MRVLAAVVFLSGCLDYTSLSSGLGGTSDASSEYSVDAGSHEVAPQTIRAVDLSAPTSGVDMAVVQPIDMASSADLAQTADLSQPADLSHQADLAQPPADMTQLPATCAEINAANPASNDGNFTLYYNHNAQKAWIAWCKGMGPGNSPVEYLPLPQGKANNYSVIGADLPSSGEYTKIRIDPMTLKVNVNDGTFNAVGQQTYGCTVNNRTTVSNVPYAYANQFCGANTGEAKIDLRGTPFKVAQNAFTVTGAVVITYSSNDQVVTMTATSGGKASAISSALQLIMP